VDAQTFVATLGKFANSGERQDCIDTFNTGIIKPYLEPSCAGTVPLNVGAALKQTAINSAVGAVPFVGQFLQALTGSIFAHHAGAVKREQAILCQAVPVAVAFLEGIDQLVASGQLDANTAAAAMDQGYQNWHPQIVPILQDTGGKCNAACFYEKNFQAAIAGRKQRYAMVGQGIVSAPIYSSSAHPVSSYNPGTPYAPAPAYAPGPGYAPGYAPAPAAIAPPLLAQAGLTPSSQSSLAKYVLIGGGALAGVVVLSILRGGK
jgi:hypothetical protein